MQNLLLSQIVSESDSVFELAVSVASFENGFVILTLALSSSNGIFERLYIALFLPFQTIDIRVYFLYEEITTNSLHSQYHSPGMVKNRRPI